MTTRILLIAPLVDIPTFTSSLAVHDILKFAKNHDNIDIDLLRGIMANRYIFNFNTFMKKYDLFSYWGHGEPDKLKGSHIWHSIINLRNIHKTKGSSFDTMACDSLQILGTYAIEKDIVKAYIGTKDKYWAAFPEKERNFLSDWIDYSTIRMKKLLEGATFGEAYNAFQKRGKMYLKIYEENRGYKNYDWYADHLRMNLENTILLGDPNIKIIK